MWFIKCISVLGALDNSNDITNHSKKIFVGLECCLPFITFLNLYLVLVFASKVNFRKKI